MKTSQELNHATHWGAWKWTEREEDFQKRATVNSWNQGDCVRPPKTTGKEAFIVFQLQRKPLEICPQVLVLLSYCLDLREIFLLCPATSVPSTWMQHSEVYLQSCFLPCSDRLTLCSRKPVKRCSAHGICLSGHGVSSQQLSGEEDTGLSILVRTQYLRASMTFSPLSSAP